MSPNTFKLIFMIRINYCFPFVHHFVKFDSLLGVVNNVSLQFLNFFNYTLISTPYINIVVVFITWFTLPDHCLL